MYQGLYPPADEDYEADRTLTVDSAHYDTATVFSISKRRAAKAVRWPLLVWVSILVPTLDFQISFLIITAVFVRYSVRSSESTSTLID